MYHIEYFILVFTICVPIEVYQTLHEIKVSLESQHFTSAPTMQDLVSVAVRRFIRDWDNTDERTQIIDELLENRQEAQSRMGKRKGDSS